MHYMSVSVGHLYFFCRRTQSHTITDVTLFAKEKQNSKKMLYLNVKGEWTLKRAEVITFFYRGSEHFFAEEVNTVVNLEYLVAGGMI